MSTSSVYLPPAKGIAYNPTATSSSTQPRIAPIAHFVSTPNDGNGSESFAGETAIPTAGRLLAVNSHYIAYAVKKGLVRVIDRHSSAKALLRGHNGRIVDASFFGESQKEGIGALWKELAANRGTVPVTSSTNVALASDILATIGGVNDSLFIWRIYNDGESLQADKLIELKFDPGRILWHPFDPNRFLLLHRKSSGLCSGKSVGSLVETKRLVTKRDEEEGHMVCDCEGSVVPGATQFVVESENAAECGVNDASWSGKDARHVLTAHDDGVRLWDVIAPVVETDESDNDDKKIKSFQCIAKIDSTQVTRVIFLSQYENQGAAITPPFVTGTDMNHSITLWSGLPAESNKCQKLCVFTLKTASAPSISTLTSLELCPAPYRPSDSTPSSFVLLSERDVPQMHALHLATEWKTNSSAVAVTGFDYVSTFDVVHPILSQCIAASNTTGSLDEEKDVDLCCVQTKAVQLLSVSGEMVAPPKSGVVPASVTIMDVENEVDDETFEEDYDMDDEPDVECSTEHSNDEAMAPKAPDTINPFSNWLGALATASSTAAPSPLPPAANTGMSAPPGLDFMFSPPPPPGMPPADSALKEEMSFLSPMQILGKSELVPEPVSSKTPDADVKKSKKKKDGKKSPPIAILQRQENETRSASTPSGGNIDVHSIENAIERVMAKQMKSFESKMLDTVRKTVASEVERAMVGSKVSKTFEKAARDSAAMAAKEAVGSMQAPMVSTLHQTMKEIMIPAYEAATSQMFYQISQSVDQGLSQIATNQSQGGNASIEAMAVQMNNMATAIRTLSSEVAQLKSGGASNSNGAQPAPKLQPEPAVDLRQEILALCQSRRYEDAFTKAVSAASGDIVVFTCKHADITVAFNGEVTLSQTILICLMQQLGAVLVSATDPTDFKIIVTWLQEIAVTIEPTNENIQRHVGSVVQQLLSNINSKMSNCDPAFRRPLQTLMQVIKGLL